MIIPIRCFTCGKVIADKYDYYLQAVAKMEHDTTHSTKTEKDKATQEADKEAKEEAYKTRHFDTIRTGAILDNMGLTRYCCRRHMLATVDMMEII
jgi:DNA-directed RNA polymerase I, II, and III subunit RPABC5